MSVRRRLKVCFASILVLVFVSLSASSATAQIRSAPGGGPWNEPATWVGGMVPGATEDVIISTGSEVALFQNHECAGLVVESGGALTGQESLTLSVAGSVENSGSILGPAMYLSAEGDITNTGTWTMNLYLAGSGTRSLDADGITGEVWVVGDVTLEGDNALSRLDQFQFPDGTLRIPPGVFLRMTTPPSLAGYAPEGISVPDEAPLDSRGSIEVANVPAGYADVVIGSDMVGVLSSSDGGELTVLTRSDEAPPGFPNAISQWYRLEWTDGLSSHPDFLTLGFSFTGDQLNGVDPSELHVYHSADEGANWTRLTTNPFNVTYDPETGEGLSAVFSAPSSGDFTIAGPGGAENAPPIARDDLAFGLPSTDLTIDVLGNDSDPEGGTLQLISVSDGALGSADVVDGLVVYTPVPDSFGEDTVTYVIVDDQGMEASAEVQIRIADPAIVLFDEIIEAEQPGDGEQVVRRRVMSIRPDVLENLFSGGASLALNLFDDEILILDEAGTTSWSETERSWMGGSARFADWVTLEYDSQNQSVYATVWAGGIPYLIQRVSDDAFEIAQLDLSSLVDDTDIDDESTQPDPGPAIEVVSAQAIDSGMPFDTGKAPTPEIDLLILFTDDALANGDGLQSSMRQRIFNAVNNTNQTYRNSGINARVRLVATGLVNYDETQKSGKDLANLRRDGRDAGSDVATLRDQYAADIVGLVVDDFDACGRAYIMKNVSVNHEDSAFFVVQDGNCLGGNLSFAHEIGHIQGARHDRFVDNNDGSPYDYNHGFVNPTNNWNTNADLWRTVMAYDDFCDCVDEGNTCPSNSENRMTEGAPSCTRLMWWSNPDVRFDGDVMGIASGNNAADNARTLDATASTVEAFRGGSFPEITGIITDVTTGAGMDSVLVRGDTPTQGYSTESDQTGFYSLVLPTGVDVVVYPEFFGMEFPGSSGTWFDPPEVSFSSIVADRTQDFLASPVFILSGRVTENSVPVGGVEIRGGPREEPITNIAGDYDLELPWDFPGAITPHHPMYDFSPPSMTFNDFRKDSTVNFAATIKRHDISGFVSTITGDYIAGVVMDGLPGNPQTDQNGFYSVTVDHGWNGTATPVKLGFNFEPPYRDYTGVTDDRMHDYDAYPGGLARSVWPMWSAGPEHSARVDIATASNTIEWNATLEGSLFPPVVGQDGTIYAATSNHLHAISPQGDKLWKIVLPGGGDTAPAAGTAGRVFMPSGGSLLAYDVSDQSVVWSFSTGGRIHSAPAVDSEGNIYVGSDSDSLYAVTGDGDRLWAFGTAGDVRTSAAISSSGNVFFGSDDGRVYALDSDGNLMWSFDTGGIVRSSPTIAADGTILVGTDADAVFAIDGMTGDEIWRFDTDGDVRGTPALGSDGAIYFGTSAGTFHALTSAGNADWEYEVAGAIDGSAAVSFTRVRTLGATGSDEEVVYVSSAGNLTYAFTIRSPSAITDRMRWLYPGSSTSPVLSESGLLVGSQQSFSQLYALRPESRALTQISVLLNDFGGNFDPDRIAAILWLEEQGGSLALFPGEGDDPCLGGPLVIPNCPLDNLFDGANPMVLVEAQREVLLGLVEFSDQLQDVVEGISTQGLIATLPLTFDAGGVSSLIVGGLVNPDLYALNPEGLSTELSVFSKDVNRETFDDSDGVHLLAGNFSTDAPALMFSLSGADQVEFDALSYGSISEVASVQEGIYDVALLQEGPGKAGSEVLARSTLDLTGKGGEFVTLFARGFMNPAANNGGPAIGVEAKSGTGDVIVGGVSNQAAVELPETTFIESVYPNPAGNRLTVRIASAASQRIQIDLFDVLGRRIGTMADESRPAGSQSMDIDVSGLGSGIYVLRITTEHGLLSRTVTVVR